MSIRAASTKRSQASSAQSGTAVAIYTGSNSISVAGAVVSSATQVSLGLVSPGQSATQSVVTVASGPVITSIQYLDANNVVISGDIAVSTSGGNILITGTGFASGSNVYLNNSLVSNTFISSTQIRATCPAASVGNVSLMIFTPTNVGTIGPNIRYSGIPNWTTSAVSVSNNVAANVALVAVGDSTLTYTLQAGSTLPTGITLDSAGYLIGTPTGYTETATVTVVVVATDQEGQATQQTINISVTLGDEYFKYTTLLLNGETEIPAFSQDSSTNKFNLDLNGAVVPSKMTPYTGYPNAGSMYVPSAVTNYLSLAHTTATTIVSGSTDSFIAECWVYFTSATATTAIMDQSGQNTVTFQNWSLNLDSAKKFQIIWGGTGSPGSQIGYISGTTVAASNTWYHLAYVKTNNVWSLFVNGTREATYTGLNTASDGTQNPLRIGSDTFSSQSINGYIADVRIYKGATADAPYDASSSTITVPTAPLTAITNTQLLTCQYNGGANNNDMIDSGPNKAVLTRNGNPSLGSFGPFSPTGWATYFNSAGNQYFTMPTATATAFGGFNGNYTTIEFWVNQSTSSTGTTNEVIGTWYPAAANGRFYVEVGNGAASTGATSKVFFQWTIGTGSVANVTTTAVVPVGRWAHIAIVVDATGAAGAHTVDIYVDGVGQSFTGKNFSSQTTTYDRLRLGGSSSTYFYGYISNLRVVRSATNVVGYSGASIAVPTSPLTAVTGTILLTFQNRKIVDNSSVNSTLTAVGPPIAHAYSPFASSGGYLPSTHSGSAYFDGTGDYYSAPYNSDYYFGTGDFTIEFWMYATTAWTSNNGPGIGIKQGDSYGGWVIYRNTSTNTDKISLRLAAQSGASNIDYPTTVSPTPGSWQHWAVVRSGTTLTWYCDGVACGVTADVSTNIAESSTGGTMNIGRAQTWSTHYTGFLSDVRVIKGTALYQANFTPPTGPLTSIANTKLLINPTTAGIVDQHSSSTLETVGNVQRSTTITKYGSASLYFDGTGDYLTTRQLYSTSHDLVLTDFTVEGWFYNTGAGAERYILSQRGASSGWEWRINATNAVQFFYTGGSSITSTGTISANTWTHIAVTRSGTTVRIFINGTLDSSATFSNGTSAASSYPLYVGYSTSGGGYYMGYMDDVRITKGYARYTANFTPPQFALSGQ